MTESEKGEPKPAASVSGDNGSDASRVSEAAAGAANESTDTEKKEEGVASPEPMPEPVEEKPISPGVTLADEPAPVAPLSSGETQDAPPQKTPMYVGLSILFILLLFYYSLIKSKEQAEKIVQIGESVSAIASQVGGLDSQINGFQKSLSRYEKSILSLELKKSLVTVDEVISKSNDRTLDAAIRTKAALRSLIDLITASSAGSRYRVKQISQGNEETLPTVSTIKAGPKEQGKENSEG